MYFIFPLTSGPHRARPFPYTTLFRSVVTEMITAEGAEATSPATFFVLANQDNRQPSPSKLTGAVGNLFLGVQIQCAECHKRSEEHTSELQSLRHLVCRLLLDNKKKAR